jgi:ferredoxin
VELNRTTTSCALWWRTEETAVKVRVDPAKCQAHGECTTHCPEVFRLDDWGYAYTDGDGQVPDGLEESAQSAVEACPEAAITSEP